ncbi:uncharacterized protein YecT (DUF1311 family) [Constrictibacter sp. MBR-5]|jgi:uncharacterized protein YecT (DUF1311 family)|uniref:lysozyme inhibitor LprI family protein n=1 Tax=Constrictibacter sp. MBR-5 TaxID=3156467 RepID=UPI00339944B0
MRSLVFAAILAVAAPVSAGASACRDAETQAAMNACVGEAFAEADAALNRDYGRLRARLKEDASAERKLVAAQRAWIAFRDAECAFSASSVEGGSAHGMVVAECRTHLTRQRVKELGYYLSCREGDLSCPAPLR